MIEDIPVEAPADLQRDNLADLQRDNLADLQRDNFADLQQDNLADLQRDYLADLQRDNPAELLAVPQLDKPADPQLDILVVAIVVLLLDSLVGQDIHLEGNPEDSQRTLVEQGNQVVLGSLVGQGKLLL